MGIDVSQWRVRIGTFCQSARVKLFLNILKIGKITIAIRVVLFLLLVVQGVESNPGPGSVNEKSRSPKSESHDSPILTQSLHQNSQNRPESQSQPNVHPESHSQLQPLLHSPSLSTSMQTAMDVSNSSISQEIELRLSKEMFHYFNRPAEKLEERAAELEQLEAKSHRGVSLDVISELQCLKNRVDSLESEMKDLRESSASRKKHRENLEATQHESFTKVNQQPEVKSPRKNTMSDNTKGGIKQFLNDTTEGINDGIKRIDIPKQWMTYIKKKEQQRVNTHEVGNGEEGYQSKEKEIEEHDKNYVSRDDSTISYPLTVIEARKLESGTESENSSVSDNSDDSGNEEDLDSGSDEVVNDEIVQSVSSENMQEPPWVDPRRDRIEKYKEIDGIQKFSHDSFTGEKCPYNLGNGLFGVINQRDRKRKNILSEGIKAIGVKNICQPTDRTENLHLKHLKYKNCIGTSFQLVTKGTVIHNLLEGIKATEMQNIGQQTEGTINLHLKHHKCENCIDTISDIATKGTGASNILEGIKATEVQNIGQHTDGTKNLHLKCLEFENCISTSCHSATKGTGKNILLEGIKATEVQNIGQHTDGAENLHLKHLKCENCIGTISDMASRGTAISTILEGIKATEMQNIGQHTGGTETLHLNRLKCENCISTSCHSVTKGTGINILLEGIKATEVQNMGQHTDRTENLHLKHLKCGKCISTSTHIVTKETWQSNIILLKKQCKRFFKSKNDGKSIYDAQKWYLDWSNYHFPYGNYSCIIFAVPFNVPCHIVALAPRSFIAQNDDRYEYECVRLATFSTYRGHGYAVKFAKAGFVFNPATNMVVCPWCHVFVHNTADLSSTHLPACRMLHDKIPFSDAPSPPHP